MKIFVPAINHNNNVKYFEIQCLIKASSENEVIITGLVDQSIVDTVQVVISIVEFNTLDIETAKGKRKIHFHFTDGSFFKEGTSCGLGIALAYFEANQKLVPLGQNILATGEIDVYGNIYEVGGVDYKLQNLSFDKAIIPQNNWNIKYNNKVLAISNIKQLIAEPYLENTDERINL